MSHAAGEAAARPLCPSAPAAAGAALIGIVQEDGHVENLPTSLTVNQAFIDSGLPYGPLERRFRFASPCQKGRCSHWSGGACGLIGHILEETAPHRMDGARPPPCSIRGICRWWEQEGPKACAACTLVMTDSRGMATAD